MKNTYLLALTVCALTITAEGADRPADGQAQRRGGNPIVVALDANGDGTLDATEISNAPAALRKLDKNGDGKLTREELRPSRPDGQSRADGQRGEGRRKRQGDAQK